MLDDDFDMLDIGMDFEIDFDDDAPSRGRQVKKTSDQYIDQVKIFLDKAEIIGVDLRRKESFCQVLESTFNNLVFPEKEQQLRIRTQTQLNLIGIVLATVAREKLIDDATIATYTLNLDSFEILLALLKQGKIKRLNLLLASSYQFRNPQHYELFKAKCLELSVDYGIHLTFAWSHFKITLLKCGDNYYHFEGSMNYSQNNMAENLIFENDKEIYDFDYNFITKIMAEQTNKALEIIC